MVLPFASFAVHLSRILPSCRLLPSSGNDKGPPVACVCAKCRVYPATTATTCLPRAPLLLDSDRTGQIAPTPLPEHFCGHGLAIVPFRLPSPKPKAAASMRTPRGPTDWLQDGCKLGCWGLVRARDGQLALNRAAHTELNRPDCCVQCQPALFLARYLSFNY